MTVPVLGHTRANPFVYFSPIAHASSNAPAHCTQDDRMQYEFHDPFSLFYFRTAGPADT